MHRKRWISSCGWWCYKKKVSKQKSWGSTGINFLETRRVFHSFFLVKITSVPRRGPKSPGMLHPGMKPWEANKMNKINSCRKKTAEWTAKLCSWKTCCRLLGFSDVSEDDVSETPFLRHEHKTSEGTNFPVNVQQFCGLLPEKMNCCCYMVWFWDDVGLDTMVAFLITDATDSARAFLQGHFFFWLTSEKPSF